jgi:hypothetical protein
MPAKSSSGRALEPVTGRTLLDWDTPSTDVPGVGVRVNVAGPTDTEGDGVGPGGVTLGLGVGLLGLGPGVLGLGVGEDGHGSGVTLAPRVPAMA